VLGICPFIEAYTELNVHLRLPCFYCGKRCHLIIILIIRFFQILIICVKVCLSAIRVHKYLGFRQEVWNYHFKEEPF